MLKELKNISFTNLLKTIDEMEYLHSLKNKYIYHGLAIIECYLIEKGSNYILENATQALKLAVEQELDEELLDEELNELSDYYNQEMSN